MDIAMDRAIFLVSIRRIIMLFFSCLLLTVLLDQGTTQTHLAIPSALENLKSSPQMWERKGLAPYSLPKVLPHRAGVDRQVFLRA